MGYLDLASPAEKPWYSSTVQPVQRLEPAGACFHRPRGEAEVRWLYGDGGPDPDICTCCGAPIWPDVGMGGLCPVCCHGYVYVEASGHLWRLALDLGARPLRGARRITA